MPTPPIGNLETGRPAHELRVLHVLGVMDRAGIETWLMNVLRRIDRTQFQFDFLVHANREGHYDEEIRSLGGRIYKVSAPKRSLSYPAALRRALSEAGPADVMHCHEHYLSGLILALADRRQYRRLIVHAHNDTKCQESIRRPFRAAYAAAMRPLIDRYADVGLACSPQAAPSLFGPNWRHRGNVFVQPYGIEFSNFSFRGDPHQFRASLGLPLEASIVAHVGRFEYQKNHDLIIEMARHLKDTSPRFHFLMIGNGSRRAEISTRIARAGLSGMFTILDNRPDIPKVLCLASDLFVFPSWHEGLGLALVEAQAAGLPTLHSSTIPSDANIIPEASFRLDPAGPVSQWCRSLQEALQLRPLACSANRWGRFESSPLSMAHSLRALLSVYLTGSPGFTN